MKRLHVHVGVKNLPESVRFHSALFGAEPIKLKPDYAKWMLDDPQLLVALPVRSLGTLAITRKVEEIGRFRPDTIEGAAS